MTNREPLSPMDIDRFVSCGYIVLRNAIPGKVAEDWWAPCRQWLATKSASLPWSEIGSHVYVPRQRRFPLRRLAPRAWHAMGQLVGGHSRIAKADWGDGFVVARPGQASRVEEKIPWHKDGFFTHYLDSPDIGLVCLALWSEVTEVNGATALARDSLPVVARALLDAPEGLAPSTFETMLPLDWPADFATGNPGDVYFLHPFLLHSRRPNRTPLWRAITNPNVRLKENLQLGGPSPVERAISNSLPDSISDYQRSTSMEFTSDARSQQIESLRNAIAALAPSWPPLTETESDDQ